MQQSNITWDYGTAYDFFVSLHVLQEPDEWGLRGAWAAGVRSRLSAECRDFLRNAHCAINVPLPFIYTLPGAKDAQTALEQLNALAPKDRLTALTGHEAYRPRKPEFTDILDDILRDGSFTATQLKRLQATQRRNSNRLNRKETERLAYWHANPVEFGDNVVVALQNYFDAFFYEEELRIQPFLTDALDKARLASESLDTAQLLEQLSNGVSYSAETLNNMDILVLAPSFWVSPFIMRGDFAANSGVYLFGARPDDASLVPGEVVPDSLYRALKALADPTRLKIMKYLSAEPQTPTELAHKLRLRPPTVIHHLHTLRLAQLVYVRISAEGRRYAARTEAIDSAMQVLGDFLQPDPEPVLGD